MKARNKAMNKERRTAGEIHSEILEGLSEYREAQSLASLLTARHYKSLKKDPPPMPRFFHLGKKMRFSTSLEQ